MVFLSNLSYVQCIHLLYVSLCAIYTDYRSLVGNDDSAFCLGCSFSDAEMLLQSSQALVELEAIHGKAYRNYTDDHTKLFLTVQNKAVMGEGLPPRRIPCRDKSLKDVPESKAQKLLRPPSISINAFIFPTTLFIRYSLGAKESKK